MPVANVAGGGGSRERRYPQHQAHFLLRAVPFRRRLFTSANAAQVAERRKAEMTADEMARERQEKESAAQQRQEEAQETASWLLNELMCHSSTKRAGLTLERIANALERIADRYELNSKGDADADRKPNG
jgi:hypothetical protein